MPSFAGFTTLAFSGSIGGRQGAHRACATAFSGAHLCHAAEYINSAGATPTVIPPTGAWIDRSALTGGATSSFGGPLSSGRATNSLACGDWTSAAVGEIGAMLQPDGGVNNNVSCATSRPLACCDSEARVEFAGFTPAAAVLSAAGRPAMHGACDLAFPGSYMCHASEYIVAASGAPIPASGAWLDPSVDASGNTQAGFASPAFARYIGGRGCANWTLGVSAEIGTMVEPDGAVSGIGACNVARPIACCW